MKIDTNGVKEIIRFNIAGAVAGATDYGLYYFFIHFLHTSVAKGVSFICGAAVAYFINKFWVFRHRHAPSYPEAGRYVIISLLALAMNIAVNQAIFNLRPRPLFFSWSIAAMLAGLFTFICFKWWVFRK